MQIRATVIESDPELAVPGYCVLRLSQIKKRAKEYAEDLLESINSGKWANARYYAYSNGVLKVLIETIVEYERNHTSGVYTALKTVDYSDFEAWKKAILELDPKARFVADPVYINDDEVEDPESYLPKFSSDVDGSAMRPGTNWMLGRWYGTNGYGYVNVFEPEDLGFQE